MKLENKVAIVTGASAGMGKAIAAMYAKEGAKVLAVARRLERLNELAKETAGYPGELIPFVGDMMDKAQVEGMVDEAVKRFGRLDILVNNAGIMDDFSPIGDFDDKMFEKVMKLNLEAPAYSMRKAVKLFEKQGGGVIINVASVGGLFGCRAGAIYTASKHGLIGLTKNTAYMYGSKNIRCNAICPGAITTEIGTGEFMQHTNKNGMDIAMKGTNLIYRPGEADEIAKVAVFLASEDSSYINGQAIVVDGGWTCY
ncbi:glucose 1-dehydrogenase [Calorimonas adulescens]|jgi:short chain dehydrogenase.|uniref:Glucose 1-dehydrogenase n=1 Tax=Calorimonas adulescens TaxID=2606906 RepID=A0A5D8Q823_9THEO|nr:glucose 1-dehydrogenase [Calorimonas adulescens]TZE80269.1 glucose 1-dehydrogenase [Calorimonas adulescens]